MAKQKKTPTPAAPAVEAEADAAVTAPVVVDDGATPGEKPEELIGDAELPIAGGAEVVTGEPGQFADGVGEDGGEAQAESGASPPDQLPQPSERETVPALVLSDNHLGKVGQVIQVDAANSEALRLGGLIDTHPNAIAAATPEE